MRRKRNVARPNGTKSKQTQGKLLSLLRHTLVQSLIVKVVASIFFLKFIISSSN
jgi:hypothetical protein